MENKWLISICAGWQQKQSILNAKSLGFKVIAFDGDINAISGPLADLFFPIDIFNHTAIIKKIKQLEIIPTVAVSFISDLGMRSAGIINDYFKTDGMSEELSNKLTNKKLQRICWDALGEFNPEWASIKNSSMKELTSLSKKFNDKVVMVKPIDAAGSKGIFKINKLSVNDINLLKESLKYSRKGEIIIEEYINGREFSVESFWSNGNCNILAVSERIILHDKTASIIMTTNLTYEIDKIIKDATIKANLALGVRFGLTHTELIIDKNKKPFLLETAGRGGGFYVFDELVQKVTGEDYSKIFIKQLMKQELVENENKMREVTIKYFPSRLGVIKSISGFEEVNKITGIKAECFVKDGDSTNSCLSDADRIGYMLVWGKTREERDYLFKKANSLITIDYY